MKARELARRLRRYPEDLRRELAAAERTNLADALSTSIRYSGGGASEATLRAADHPYAVRHGAPMLNPAIINVRSGRFAGSWQAMGPSLEGDALRSAVFNVDPVGRYLEQGTRRMFARPLGQAVAEEIAPRVQFRRNAAARRAMEKLR